MSPFGRKSHSRKASGAAVVGGGVRFFSHAQQQQPALFFFFFQSRPRTVLTTFHFAWCSLSRDRQTASFLRARGGSSAVERSGGFINSSIGPRLLPCILPLLSTFSQRKNNSALFFLSLPICSIRLSSVYAITYHTNSVAWPPERVVGLGHTCHKGACVYPCVRAHH